ncbi:SET domain-containing protein-lysine N-methyltransferase [Candidatus Parcubacteria bacterium]|nr:SET domain-containing protein-lysine N-methyltransferase [Candidatus Parcubacteria bacterium]
MRGLEVRDARSGRGIFALREFRSKQKLFIIKGKVYHWSKLFKIGGKIGDNAFRFGPEMYLSPEGEIGDFLNHSCSPNCGVRKTGSNLELFAITPIQIGQELVMDYSTIIGKDDIWKMKCNCGSKNCRKVVRNFFILPKELQEEYMALGIVPKYILNSTNS